MNHLHFKEIFSSIGIILLFFSNIISLQADSSLIQSLETESNPIKRIQILLQICELPQASNLEWATLYTQQAYQEARETEIDSLIAFAQIKVAEVQYKSGRLKESKQNLEEALLIFEQYQLTEKIAFAQNSLGIVNGMCQNNLKALKHFFKALEFTKNKRLKVKIYNNLIQIYQCTKKYGLALDFIQKYSAIAHEQNDSTLIINSNFLMASLYLRQHNLEKAKEYLRQVKPLVYNHETRYRLANLYHNTAVILITEKKYEEATEYNETALKLHLKLDNKVNIARSYINSSIINTKTQHFSAALDDLKKGWAYHKGTDNHHQSMMMNYSILSFALDSMNTAYDESFLPFFNITDINQLAETLVINCTNTGDFCLSSNIYELLLKHYVNQNNLEKAFECQTELGRLKDSISFQERRQSISKFDFKLYTKNKEQELSQKAHQITLLEKEKLKEQNALLVGTAAFLLLLIALLLINTKRKQLQREAELTHTKLENTRLTLENKKQDLKHLTREILFKNTLIHELESDIESKAFSIHQHQEEKINLLRQQQILTQEDWDNFKAVFSEVYPNFLNKINQEFSKLTPAELRMFMLLKINLSKQQISNILGISTESVRKTKYRLKKKLKLSNEQDLEHFVQNFE